MVLVLAACGQPITPGYTYADARTVCTERSGSSVVVISSQDDVDDLAVDAGDADVWIVTPPRVVNEPWAPWRFRPQYNCHDYGKCTVSRGDDRTWECRDCADIVDAVVCDF